MEPQRHTKLRELFELVADGVKKQAATREQQEYTQSQRVVKVAQSEEETKAWNKKKSGHTTKRMTTQSQTRDINQEVTLHMQETQREKNIGGYDDHDNHVTVHHPSLYLVVIYID